MPSLYNKCFGNLVYDCVARQVDEVFFFLKVYILFW